MGDEMIVDLEKVDGVVVVVDSEGAVVAGVVTGEEVDSEAEGAGRSPVTHSVFLLVLASAWRCWSLIDLGKIEKAKKRVCVSWSATLDTWVLDLVVLVEVQKSTSQLGKLQLLTFVMDMDYDFQFT